MRFPIFGLLALTACASGPSQSDVAAATMHQASAACAERLRAGGMTRLQWQKCTDDGRRAFALVVYPQFIGLENEIFAKNEFIAAEYDEGKLSNTEASAIISANEATLEREKLEVGQRRRTITCQTFGTRTICN